MSEKSGEEWEYLSTNVLPFLYAEGWQESDVLLAWDFTTVLVDLVVRKLTSLKVSEQYSIGRAKKMRETAEEYYSKLAYEINSIDNLDCTSSTLVGRTIWGILLMLQLI